MTRVTFGSTAVRYARRSLAIAAIAAAFVAARPNDRHESDLARLAEGIRFDALQVGQDASPSRGYYVRPVHPSLSNISSWISSVGAGIALADLDGDGLPNDYCLTDPRDDSVTIGPVPGTSKRFDPVTLGSQGSWRPSAVAPMGCLPADIDEDGRLDVLVYFWGRTPIAFLRRGGDPGPHYEAIALMPEDQRWYSNAALFTDVDGDGHLDLVVGNYFADGARILDPTAGGHESMQASMSRARNGGSKQLWRWSRIENGVPRFERVENWIDESYLRGWTLGLGAADLDGDLRPELYFANDFGPDDLLHNRSDGRGISFVAVEGRRGWTMPASRVAGRDSFKGMGVDFGDVNGDGWPDIYVSNIAAEMALEESHFLFVSTGDVERFRQGIAPYVDRGEPLGVARSSWGWDVRLADFDNDGALEAVQATGFIRGEVNRWPELHELAMGNDNLLRHPASWPRFTPGTDLSGRGGTPFFVRRRGPAFHEVGRFVGTDQRQIARGLAIGDVDGDGRLDFAAANQWEPSRFYHNVSTSAGSFLGLHLLYANGPGSVPRVSGGHPAGGSGSPAVGAVVDARTATGLHSVTQIDGGSGHSGKRSPEAHLGLGRLPASSVVQTQIRWRTATGIHRLDLELRPGWHTVWLPRN